MQSQTKSPPDTPSKGVALITGSAQGIGRAISLRLASDGFDIALNDVPSKAYELTQLALQIDGMGRRCAAYPADVSEESSIKMIMESIARDLGGLDVLVANAAITLHESLVETSTEDLDRIMAINARAPYLCYKYAAIQMISQGRGGRIIGASSLAGKQGHMLGSAYSGTKFFVRGLTQSSALELGPYGITVNAYAPGYIDTDMMKNALPADDEEAAEARANVIDKTPVRRIGDTDDIAGLVSYLASKESSFMTGQTISINGGLFFD